MAMTTRTLAMWIDSDMYGCGDYGDGEGVDDDSYDVVDGDVDKFTCAFAGDGGEAPGHGAEQGETTTHAGHGGHDIWLTSPRRQDTTITQEYVCRIMSCRHITIRPLASGFLQPITVKEGQRVKAGDELFQIVPAVYQARLEADRSEAEAARIECANTRKLVEDNVISAQELAIAEAKLGQAELETTNQSLALNVKNLHKQVEVGMAGTDDLVEVPYAQPPSKARGANGNGKANGKSAVKQRSLERRD